MEYLKDVDIDFGSILIDTYTPTNGRKPIIKGMRTDGKEQFIRVAKADITKGELHLDLMVSEFEDSQGQGYTADEVEKAQFRRLDKIIKSGSNIPADINHSNKAEESVYLKQSFTFTEIDKAFYKDEIEHTVFREVYGIENNPVLMQKAKDNAITGVSIAGRAQIDTEKGMFQKFFDFIKGTKSDFEKDLERSKIWRAFDAFRSNVAKYEYNREKGYDEEKIILTKPEYDAQVDELAEVLKTIDLEIINKGEPDMKKELEDFLKTDEAKAELEKAGFIPKPAEPDTGNTELQKANDELKTATDKIAELEKANADLTSKVTDLESKTATGDGKGDGVVKSFDELVKEHTERINKK